MFALAGVWLFAYCRATQTHEHRPIVLFATAKPVLEAPASELPPQLREPNEGQWKAWAQHEDNVVRARLEQGALDSMINLLLFGTSFTTQPRGIAMSDFEDPVVQARVMPHPVSFGLTQRVRVIDSGVKIGQRKYFL